MEFGGHVRKHSCLQRMLLQTYVQSADGAAIKQMALPEAVCLTGRGEEIEHRQDGKNWT
jgi:hypothetical protein